MKPSTLILLGCLGVAAYLVYRHFKGTQSAITNNTGHAQSQAPASLLDSLAGSVGDVFGDVLKQVTRTTPKTS